MIYLNDILIFSKSRDEHVIYVKTILERLRQYRLFIKILKCKFIIEEVDFLKFISLDGVSIEKSRVAVILKWPEPTFILEL